MAEELSPLVTGVTPLVNTLERVQDVLPNREPYLEPTVEQAADIVDARDTIQKAKQDKNRSALGRILTSTAKGARFGGLGIGAKFGLIFGQQHDPLKAIAAGAGVGALGGGAVAGGLEALDILTQKRRKRLAQQTLENANPRLSTRLQDRDVATAARRYGLVRNAPLLGAEFLGTLGGIAGSAAGIRAIPPGPETVKTPLGFDVNRDQIVNAGRWGLGGVAGGTALGLLAGVIWKHHRRQKLINQLMSKRASIELDIDIGDTLLGGRFKNVPIKVKEIGTDDLGQPTVNGRKLLSYRIQKNMPEKESVKEAKSQLIPVNKPTEDSKDPWPSTNVPGSTIQTGGNPIKASNRRLMDDMGGTPERYSLGRIVKSAVERALTNVITDKPEQGHSETVVVKAPRHDYRRMLQNMARRRTETETEAQKLMKHYGVYEDHVKQAADLVGKPVAPVIVPKPVVPPISPSSEATLNTYHSNPGSLFGRNQQHDPSGLGYKPLTSKAVSNDDMAHLKQLVPGGVKNSPNDYNAYAEIGGKKLWLPDDRNRATTLHEFAHLKDVPEGHEAKNNTEIEVPPMVVEDAEAMREGVTPAQLEHDSHGDPDWRYDAIKKYGPQFTGKPTDFDVTADWMKKIRGDTPLNRTYREFLEQARKNPPQPLEKTNAAESKLRSRSEVVIYSNDGILGIKKDGYLLMPGGGIDDGETPEASAYREAIEEADRKLLHLTPMGVVEAIWPKGMKLVDGYDGERTYFFRALDGGKLGTTHDDNEGFKTLSFSEAKQFLESLIDNDDQSWAREANKRRLDCIVASERSDDEEGYTPVKLAKQDDAWLRSLCCVHAVLAKTADKKTEQDSPAQSDPEGKKVPVPTEGPRTTLMAEDEPDLQGGGPAVLIDLDRTVRDWSADGRLRNLGSQYLLPNRKETLQPLKDAGCSIIGVTNHSCHADDAHRGLTPEMLNQLQHETLGLTEGFLDDIVYTPSPDAKVLKPAPTMLHFAMKRFGLDPKRTIMVGDWPAADGKAAEAAGVPFHHTDDFFKDPAATVQLITKHLKLEKPIEKTADQLQFLDRPEYVYFNPEGKVLAAKDKDRRFRFPTLSTEGSEKAPYEPSLHYIPPEGVTEPGAHGYNVNFNLANLTGDQQDLQGAEWQDPQTLLKQLYGSMGMKQNTPYRELDRARARVILRAYRQRLKRLAAEAQPASSIEAPQQPITPVAQTV